MRYLALACDYDGTLADNGRVSAETISALERFLASGRRLIMVTGRELEDLRSVFLRLDLFEWIVAENGAVLYSPGRNEEKILSAPPPEEFVNMLRRRGVSPVSMGRAIVATWHPHEAVVLETIREMGLELQVIFNKDAVMVLPTGVNKATGMAAALAEMGLSRHNVVGVGDAENDHAFLQSCECAVAVANALPSVKERADLVTAGDHGTGVRELIDRIIATDLSSLEGKLHRHRLVLGTARDGSDVAIAPYHVNVLIAGPSGSGKSTVATALLERLADHGYQFCVIDPEGDYDDLENAVAVGSSRAGPDVEQVLQLLAKPSENVTVNLVGLPLADRPSWFLGIFPRLQEMRARTGHPHWLLLDEAHHLLPASWQRGEMALTQELDRLLLITVHPNQVAPSVVRAVQTLIAVGPAPAETIEQFCAAAGACPSEIGDVKPSDDAVVLWSRGGLPVAVRVKPAQMERRRHIRKYAEGELSPEKSFYFRGADGKLNLRAQNLILFNQLAEGVDDATWLHHLHRHDYSGWFRDKIKDGDLAAAAEQIESDKSLSPQESRQRIKAAIERYYTLPSSPPMPVAGTDAAPKP